MHSQLALVLAAFSLAPLLAAGEPAPGQPVPGPDFRLYTRAAGLHRVTFEQLEAAGLPPQGMPTELLSLETGGRVVPLHLRDGDDGVFGPGDSFEFVAEILAGENTFYHPHSRHNVYRLRWRAAAARRLRPVPPSAWSAASDTPVPIERRVHLEEDRLLIRLAAADVGGSGEPEIWYWGKITSHRDSEPFRVPLDLRDARIESLARLRVGLRGLSTLPRGQRAENVMDHSVALDAAGLPLNTATWSGKQPFTVSRPNLNLATLTQSGDAVLEIAVNKRRIAEQKAVDVVMVDFAAIEYVHNGRIGAEGVRLHLPANFRGGAIELVPSLAGELIVVGRELGLAHRRVVAGERHFLTIPSRETSVWVGFEASIASPVAVEADAPSDLRRFDRQADYLVIAHASLLDASRDLVTHHRKAGLSVELIDVQDVYDEFGDGIIDPAAIRDFVAHAYHNWLPPRPRFVLLVGDASWDTKNSTVDEANYANWVGQQLVRGNRFVAKDTADYDAARRNDRNLIPSWNFHTAEGHAASDAYFTLVDGDDDLPDLALGRLPVASPEEVRAITTKIVNYVESAPLGPWRNHLVWISGALKSHQNRTTLLAGELAERGLRPTIILPGEAARPEDRARIVDALDEGSLVTHFIGHGGRFIWRTGPPDLSDQVDLFDLGDLEQLQNEEALSVVLSVSCYSAPFDHPSADSIGEAFLRLPNRGAVAFIGASWRNAPPIALSRALVDELSRPGTIGEALMKVKRQVTRPDVVHLFNLLGDPAVPIAAPQRHLDVAHSREEDALVVSFVLPEQAVGGRMALDYFDEHGERLDSTELAAETTAIHVRRPALPDARTVAVYYWNEATRVDGAGAAVLDAPDLAAAAGN